MARACHAGIEGVDGAQHFERLFRIANRISQQRHLVRAGLSAIVARAGIGLGDVLIFD